MNKLVLILATASPFIAAAIIFGSLLQRMSFAGLAKLIKRMGGVVPAERIEQELKRKSFHLQALLIPAYEFTALKLNLVNRKQIIVAMGILVTFLLCLELLRMFNGNFNDMVIKFFGPLLRPKERRAFTGATPLIIACFITFLVFPPLVSMLGMAYLTFGDASAAIIGVSFGKHKLIGKKSLEGFLGCTVSCTIVGFLALQLLTGTSVSSSLRVALGSGFMAALAELFSNERLDDNMAIPIVSSVAIFVAGVLEGAEFVRRDTI